MLYDENVFKKYVNVYIIFVTFPSTAMTVDIKLNVIIIFKNLFALLFL